jgi:hypothetical protein
LIHLGDRCALSRVAREKRLFGGKSGEGFPPKWILDVTRAEHRRVKISSTQINTSTQEAPTRCWAY